MCIIKMAKSYINLGTFSRVILASIFGILIVYAIAYSKKKSPETFMGAIDIPTQSSSIIPSIQGLDYIYETEDRGKFALPREVRNIVPSSPTMTISDQEYEWSDNVYGLLSVDNSMFIAVDDRNRIQKTPLLANGTLGVPEIVGGRRDIILNPFDQPDRSYPAPTYCPNGLFGQGAKARTGFYVPVKMCNNTIGNGTYIQYRNDTGSMGASAGFLANRSIDWIAIDPITEFFFMSPNNGSSLNSVAVYDWSETRYNVRTSTSMNPRLVRNIPLFRSGRQMNITNVTAACFSSNGIFYVLCNDNGNTSGVYSFSLNMDGTKLNFTRFIPIMKQEESFGGIDTQSLVGITCKRTSLGHDDLYVLYLNKDIGTDNISLIKVSRVW
jgi:hypothetical protein